MEPRRILTLGPLFYPWWFVVGRGTFMCAAVIPSSALQQHYEINALTEKAPILHVELSSSQGVPSLAHPEIAGPLRAHSTTLFEHSVIRAITFACSLKAAKPLCCRVTISSILQ